MKQLVDTFLEKNNIWSFEGITGRVNFDKLINAIGYETLDCFLEDNPGALQVMSEWIGTQRSKEWKANIEEKLKT
jgi:hypothetical protein